MGKNGDRHHFRGAVVGSAAVRCEKGVSPHFSDHFVLALQRLLDARADFGGLVFFPRSPRHVSLEQARALAELQHVDLLIGGENGIEGVHKIEVAAPYTQRALLEQVRAALNASPESPAHPPPNPALTFSASVP